MPILSLYTYFFHLLCCCIIDCLIKASKNSIAIVIISVLYCIIVFTGLPHPTVKSTNFSHVHLTGVPTAHYHKSCQHNRTIDPATGTGCWACACVLTDMSTQVPYVRKSQSVRCSFPACTEPIRQYAGTCPVCAWRSTRSACLFVTCGFYMGSSHTVLVLPRLLHGSK